MFCGWNCTVTTVDSGMRALKYLGLDEEESSVSIDVRNFCWWIFFLK